MRTHVTLCVLLAVAVLAIYAQVVHFGINDFDDPDYVFNNPHVRTGLSLRNVAWALTASHAGNWHPITSISHMADVQLYGLNPGAQHSTSVLIHILNSCLLFLVLSGMTGSIWRSAFVAALFAVHPMNVESVAWISERKNVLSTTFLLLTVWAYAGYARRGGLGRYLLVIALFALGLAAKPMLVTLPIVLLLLDFWPLKRVQDGVRWGRLLAEKAPLALLSAASCWITLILQRDGGMTRTLERLPIGERVANALVSYVAYIGKMLWPSKLCVLYPHPEGTLPVWWTLSCATMLLAATVAAITVRRGRPYLTAGWLWYLVTLVPVIGLVQVGPQAMADRYAYVPFLGLFIAIAWIVPEIAGAARSRWLLGPAAAVLAAFGVAAWLQASYWVNADTLFQRALDITHNRGAAIYCRADVLADAGKFGQAQRVLQDALRASREPEVVHNYMGMLLARGGRLPEAVAQYRQAIAIDPGYAVVRNNLGTALARLGRLEESASNLRKAIELEPDYPEAHHSLGVVLYRQGNVEAAIAQWEKALELRPGFAPARLRLEQVQHHASRQSPR